MKRMLVMMALLTLTAAGRASAEFHRIDLRIFGMD